MSLLPLELYKVKQIRELEKNAIQDYGLPEQMLMERAGFAQTEWERRPAMDPTLSLFVSMEKSADFEGFLKRQSRAHAWLPAELAWRYARNYGTRMDRLLDGASGLGDLGEDFGAGLHAAEVDYLVRQEFAKTAEDILWRRSKLGLHVPTGTAERLDRYLGNVTSDGGTKAAKVSR